MTITQHAGLKKNRFDLTNIYSKFEIFYYLRPYLHRTHLQYSICANLQVKYELQLK